MYCKQTNIERKNIDEWFPGTRSLERQGRWVMEEKNEVWMEKNNGIFYINIF